MARPTTTTEAAPAAAAAAAATSTASPTSPAAEPDLPTRCEPVLGADGIPWDLLPPCGGHWLRDVDGGLSPADEGTARAAGLAWPGG